MKVAVLVPVYNAAKYLRECLDSLLSQDVDVFCCDDGSTDGSRAILAEYARKTNRLCYLSQANAGVVAARNRLMDGLPAAYDAFAFCDSDDTVKPGLYALLAETMERTDADVVECGMPGNSVAEERTVDDMSLYLLRRTAPGPWINVVNKLYRRTAVGNVRFRAGLRFEEDLFFNYEVNAVIRRKTLVPGVYYDYRDNPDSATQALDLDRYFESTTRRIRLSLEVFWKAGRVPKAVEPAWLAELSKDAYRMCLRKNLKKNPDAKSRRALFLAAGDFFRNLERDFGFSPVGLNVLQGAICRACLGGHYALARLLVSLT